MELLFGEGSYVVVNHCKYLTNTYNYLIDCKVFVSSLELSKDVYPDGLVLLVEDSWKFVGIDAEVVVVTSIDIS